MKRTRMWPAGWMLILWLASGAARAVELPGPLVETDWLDTHLDQVVVLDVRDEEHSFTAQARLGRNEKSGKLRMLQMGAHIPGARLINFKWLTAPQQIDGRIIKRMMPPPDEFEYLMQSAGVDRDSTVVIVSKGMDVGDLTQAARLYWQLRIFGHDAVAVLNGGTAQWLLEERPASRDPSPELQGDWKAGTVRRGLLAESAAVEQAVSDGKVQLVDNRPLPQYLGVEKRSYVRSRGHIPGAKPFPLELMVDPGIPARFRSIEELRELHTAMGLDSTAPAITYCNSGHFAAGGWFILHELLGNGQTSLYDGSMHQWAMERRPVKNLVLE